MAEASGTIDFWFDAGCPFTWRTARWVVAAAGQRDVTLRWHLMSLYKLNEGKEIPEQYRARMEQGRETMRVLAAAAADGGPEVVQPLYFAVGRRRHDEGRDLDRSAYEEALAEVGLPAAMADAAGDSQWDEVVYKSHAEGQAAVGEDSGSPVLSFDGAQAFFGPVLSAVPSEAHGVKLLDALMAAAHVPEFAELKRSRSGRK